VDTWLTSCPANLGRRGEDSLREAGHDVRIVDEQVLLSTTARKILDHCRLEGRALVTLDRGLADPVVHNPADYAEIAVLRLPAKPQDVRFNKGAERAAGTILTVLAILFYPEHLAV
jgi:hypothetical protein